MADFTTIEKVVAFTGKKGKLRYSPRNLANHDKRVMLRMVSEDSSKEELTVLLSKTLSEDFRSKKVGVGHLMALSYGYTMIEGEKVYYIGNASDWTDLSLETYTETEIPSQQSAVSIEDLLDSI